jgi:hypothetical protein
MPKGQTLAMIAAGRVGVIKSARVMAFMVQWQIAADDLGREPTVEEYAEWWNSSRRTAFREQALFREAFPGENTPRRLLDLTAHAWATRPSKRPSPKVLGDATIAAT